VETSILFGPNDALVGTINHASSNSQSDIGFVFLNAGVVHRVGPHRINVKLARAVAKLHIPSIRFDLSGLGDSQRYKPAQNAGYDEMAAREISASLDTLTAKTGVTRFVLCAVCSGTVHAYAAATHDPRIVGMLLLDGYMYPTQRAKLNYFWLRAKRRLAQGNLFHWLASKAKPRSVARATAPAEAKQAVPAAKAGDTPGFFAHRPEKQEFAAMLRTLAQRGVEVCFIYAGGGLQYYNYPRQFDDVFGKLVRSDRVTSLFLRDIDHTVTRIAAQQALISAIINWTKVRYRA
jgi:pimeloyl-ACP methyl ester carboxylesterase